MSAPRPRAPAAVAVERLTVERGGRPVVQDVAFEVGHGEVVGLVGKRHAGTSTVLRALLGLVPATGRIRLLGRPYRDLPDPAAAVGVFLGADGHPGVRVRDHVRIAAALRGAGADDVERVIADAGLADRADARRRALPASARQRLGIAAVRLTRPRLAILDDPATGLDPEGVAWLRGLLRALADEGCGVLVACHPLSAVAEDLDRAVALDGGRVVVDAPPEEIRAQAGTEVVARTPDAEALADRLREVGAEDATAQGDEVRAVDVSPAAVTRVAADERIPLLEARAEEPTLEEALDVVAAEAEGTGVPPGDDAEGHDAQGADAGGDDAQGADADARDDRARDADEPHDHDAARDDGGAALSGDGGAREDDGARDEGAGAHDDDGEREHHAPRRDDDAREPDGDVAAAGASGDGADARPDDEATCALRAAAADRTPRVVAFASPARGAGTTTLAALAADVLATAAGRPVLAVGLTADGGRLARPVPPAGRSRLDVVDLARDLPGFDALAVADPYLSASPTGLHVLAGAPDPDALAAIDADAVRALLAHLAGTYDRIVVDVGADLAADAAAAVAEAADAVVLVGTPDAGDALTAPSPVVDALERRHPEPAVLVLNRTDREQARAFAAQRAPDRAVVPEDEALRRALERGVHDLDDADPDLRAALEHLAAAMTGARAEVAR